MGNKHEMQLYYDTYNIHVYSWQINYIYIYNNNIVQNIFMYVSMFTNEQKEINTKIFLLHICKCDIYIYIYIMLYVTR